MESAIRLSVDCKYPVLPKGDYCEIRVIGMGPDEAVAYYAYGEEEGLCVLVHLHDGVAERHELQVSPDLLMEKDSSHKRPPVLMKANGRLVLLVNMRLLYAVDTSLRVTDHIVVENELPAEKRLRRDHPYPAERTGFSDTDLVPLFFDGEWIGLPHYIALLRVAIDSRTAAWVDFGGKRLFSCGRRDIPVTHLNTYVGNADPIIYHAVYRNGQLLIYTIGNSSSYCRYGMPYFGLAVFDEQRHLLELPLMERPAKDDPKKRGRLGKFTSSTTYCIVTPFFVASDPWKKKQHLFDLNERQLHEVILPRGLSSKFSITP